MPGTQMDWLESRKEETANVLAEVLTPHVYEDATYEIVDVDERGGNYSVLVSRVSNGNTFFITVEQAS